MIWQAVRPAAVGARACPAVRCSIVSLIEQLLAACERVQRAPRLYRHSLQVIDQLHATEDGSALVPGHSSFWWAHAKCTPLAFGSQVVAGGGLRPCLPAEGLRH